MKLFDRATGALQVLPSSECVTNSSPPPMLKLLNEMYMRPYFELKGLLSTHIDSRSSPELLCGQVTAVQVIPSGELHSAMPWPPQPPDKSPANHLSSFLLKTTIGSPKLAP